MVRCNGIDGAINNTGQDGCAMVFRTEWRVDLKARFIRAQGFIGEDQMLRCRFSRHFEALGFRLADHFYSALGADMGNVDRCIRQLR